MLRGCLCMGRAVAVVKGQPRGYGDLVDERGPFGDGCGSFEVSWLRCEDEVFAVYDSVDALVLLAEVEAPVVLEVACGDDGAELEDGLGAFESPSCAGYVHSVLYEVPAGTLDDPGGDGPAFLQRGGVAEVVLLVLQVAGAFVGAGALGAGVSVGGGAAADPGRDLGRVPVQDLACLGGDPFLGGGFSLVKEGPGGLPQVFQHVDEVDDDRDRDAAPGCLGGDGLDLGVVAVDQDGPFALVLRVAAFGLLEGGGDDGGDVIGDRGGQPLAPRLRFPRLSPALRLRCLRLLLPPLLRGRADDILRRARDRGGVVDAGQLGHPLAAVLLPGRQPGRELALRRGGGLRGRRAQRTGQHHDALPVEGQDQRPAVRRRDDHAGQIERLHMRGAAAGQLLCLPFSYYYAGRAGDRGGRRLHRAARGLDRGQLAQPVGVLLLRQVQFPVQQVHVRPAG